MLMHLSIRDLAVVEALDLEFDRGLTVLTGETGAGKSILLTAVGLALGDRADSGFVRPGASRADISLGFDTSDSPAARRWLEDNALDQDGECLVRRIVGQDGRSKAYINSRPVNLQALQELGSALLEIHGQHAHVQLLKAHEQRRLLDEAAGNRELLARTEALCRAWREASAELARRDSATQARMAREDLLRYQIDELEQHDVAELGYAALTEEHALQANMGKIISTGRVQLDSLYEQEGASVYARLVQASHALSDLCELAPEFQEAVTLLEETQVQVKEASLHLRRQLERMEADPARLDWLEQRLADIHRLARKHRVGPDELPGYLLTLVEELRDLVQGAEAIDALRAEVERIYFEYQQAARALSERRRLAAIKLQDRVSSVIRELGMPQGNLQVEVRAVENEEPAPYGADYVEFLVSANPGLPPRPLARVASGGELSRISLAIQVVATDSKTVPSLIFDEVDTGIGGAVAEVVGQKLRVLAEQGRQVFCVTHLPQVAAQGHQHLLVEKFNVGNATQSTVRKLAGAERTREVGRMLGGLRVTRHTLAHAEEMLGIHRRAE
jgi:DNA repair protein RecN (Recombination protein N)